MDTFLGRVHRFMERGLGLPDAETLADRLVLRDREGDDRHACLECQHCTRAGCGAGAMGTKGQPLGAIAVMLQRCLWFKGVRP